MIDELRAMAIFAETIRQGSFRAAADTLGLSPSVVSYHITQLETRIGTALIYRSTRKISLTAEGEVLYQHAQQMLEVAQIGLSKVTPDQEVAKGRLRITFPSVLTRAPITASIAGFVKRYPQIELQVVCTDERQDLIEQGIDLAIRVGGMEDSALKAKQIGEIPRRLVCAPEYLRQQLPPSEPQQLNRWQWIKLAMLPDSRTLIGPDNTQVDCAFSPHTVVNTVELMTQFCIHGLGLATPPDFLVEQALKAGELVEPLPGWRVSPIPVYAVWPANVTEGSNTRRLLRWLES